MNYALLSVSNSELKSLQIERPLDKLDLDILTLEESDA